VSENLLDQGLTLMPYGMGTVFGFLSLLVIMTQIMSWMILKFYPEKSEALNVDRDPGNDQTPVAVISAAVHYYRTKHKNKLSP